MIGPISLLNIFLLLTTVFGVILQSGGLGFVNTAYSLFLQEQVIITPYACIYTYIMTFSAFIHATFIIIIIVAWPNSRKSDTCFSSHLSTLCNFSSPDWEAGWQNCKLNQELMKHKRLLVCSMHVPCRILDSLWFVDYVSVGLVIFSWDQHPFFQ